MSLFAGTAGCDLPGSWLSRWTAVGLGGAAFNSDDFLALFVLWLLSLWTWTLGVVFMVLSLK